MRDLGPPLALPFTLTVAFPLLRPFFEPFPEPDVVPFPDADPAEPDPASSSDEN